MTTENPEIDSRKATPLRRSTSKSFKDIIRIFKSDSSMRLRIPSFREPRKSIAGTTTTTTAGHQIPPSLLEPESLLREIPALDFQKLKSDLYVDLAYTNNLLRQRIHRDNLINLVAQITECLRLIRCRVATAAAYIRTDATPSSLTTSTNNGTGSGAKSTNGALESTEGPYYSENRVILEAVSRFENAYVAFSGWLTELEALNPPPMEVLPLVLGDETDVGAATETSKTTSGSKKGAPSVTLPLPPSRPASASTRVSFESPKPDGVVTLDDVGEVMARGNACFLAIQTAAESVFLSLEASGCTQPTTPQALSCVNGAQSPLTKAKQFGFRSFHFARAPPSSNHSNNVKRPSTQSQAASAPSVVGSTTSTTTTTTTSQSRSGGGLTAEDRRLLAQLWSQVEPSGDSPPPPPPKPPLSLESPRWSAGESMADLPITPTLPGCLEPGYTNVREDTKLNAYLMSLAEAIQANPLGGGTHQMEESIYSSIDDSPPPPSPQQPPELPPRNGNTRQNGCLDLNSLNLPHADDSDASEKENEERVAMATEEGEETDRLRGGCIRTSGQLICSLNSKKSPPQPPPPPPSTKTTTAPNQTSVINSPSRKGNKTDGDAPWEPLESANLPSKLVSSISSRESNPLSDASMQREVLSAVRRLQDGTYKERSPQHTSTTNGTDSSSGCVCSCSDQTDVSFSGGGGGVIDGETPCCHAETKSDTEDDFEMIFANGKKYKRYVKRHIVFQRHVCRQVVFAPSLPDGSGPDLSKQVPQGVALPSCRLDTMPGKGSPTKATNGETGGTQVPRSDELSCSSASSQSSSTCGSLASHGKPPTPPGTSVANNGTSIHVSATNTNNTLTSYMYKFGRSEPQEGDVSLESRICRNVADFFHARWSKRESAAGPHERSKTVTYFQKFSQPSLAGPPIHHNTCAQQTCRVRMVGGLEELKQQQQQQQQQQVPSIPVVNPPSRENSLDEESVNLGSSASSASSTLPRMPPRGRPLSRGPPTAIDRRKSKSRPISNLQLPPGDQKSSPLKIEVPSESQPTLTNLSEVGITVQDKTVIRTRRKISLEGAEASVDVGGASSGRSSLVSPVCLIPVELPSVEKAESGHPLLMELDATPYLELDDSDSANELQVQAGTIDALIVYATSLGRSHRSFLLMLDVFLVMYRTFMSSEDLVSRLIQRYLLFQSSVKLIASVEEKTREKICNVVISYLIRVISQLSGDLTSQLYSLLNAFRDRVMDDGYGGLARALEFTLLGQLKRSQNRRASNQSQEAISLLPAASSSPRPSIESYGSSIPPPSSPASDTAPSAVSVRRSHSIGAVTNSAIAIKTNAAKNGEAFKGLTAPHASARNSFSSPQGEENSLGSSPTASAALSEIDFETLSGSGTHPTPTASVRHSTSSCFSSPAASRRLLLATGLSANAIGTFRRHPGTAGNTPRRMSLLDIPAKLLAEQITYLEAQKYSRLTLEELLDIKSLAALKAPVMAACAAQFTALSNWAATLLLAPPAVSQRERHAVKLLKVMNYLHILKNFNSFLAILCAFLLVPENIFSKKTRARLARLRPYMQPPHFSDYRRELAEATPPLIPYLGLTLQNLIALGQINPLFLSEVPESMAATHKPEYGRIVNFWRSWKHFLIINFFVKQDNFEGKAAQYDIKPDVDVLYAIDNFKTAYPDFALRELISRRKREFS